jgi:hypothetical protein
MIGDLILTMLFALILVGRSVAAVRSTATRWLKGSAVAIPTGVPLSSVIPAKAGAEDDRGSIHTAFSTVTVLFECRLDSRFRGNDGYVRGGRRRPSPVWLSH